MKKIIKLMRFTLGTALFLLICVTTVNASNDTKYLAVSENSEIVGDVTNLVFEDGSCSFDIGNDSYNFTIDTLSIIDGNVLYVGTDGSYSCLVSKKEDLLSVTVMNKEIHYSLRSYENGNFTVMCEEQLEYMNDHHMKLREITKHGPGLDTGAAEKVT